MKLGSRLETLMHRMRASMEQDVALRDAQTTAKKVDQYQTVTSQPKGDHRITPATDAAASAQQLAQLDEELKGVGARVWSYDIEEIFGAKRGFMTGFIPRMGFHAEAAGVAEDLREAFAAMIAALKVESKIDQFPMAKEELRQLIHELRDDPSVKQLADAVQRGDWARVFAGSAAFKALGADPALFARNLTARKDFVARLETQRDNPGVFSPEWTALDRRMLHDAITEVSGQQLLEPYGHGIATDHMGKSAESAGASLLMVAQHAERAVRTAGHWPELPDTGLPEGPGASKTPDHLERLAHAMVYGEVTGQDPRVLSVSPEELETLRERCTQLMGSKLWNEQLDASFAGPSAEDIAKGVQRLFG